MRGPLVRDPPGTAVRGLTLPVIIRDSRPAWRRDGQGEERRELVLAALVRAGADGVSGQALADRLGCSRAAVHRHVEALRRAGVAVDGVHEGYRLGPECDARRRGRPKAMACAGPCAGAARPDHQRRPGGAGRDGAPEGRWWWAPTCSAFGRSRAGGLVTRPGDALLFSVLLHWVPAAEAAVLPVMWRWLGGRGAGPRPGGRDRVAQRPGDGRGKGVRGAVRDRRG
ncbi:MAG: HTH domain-containing protein [Thermoleophilia bacterium]